MSIHQETEKTVPEAENAAASAAADVGAAANTAADAQAGENVPGEPPAEGLNPGDGPLDGEEDAAFAADSSADSAENGGPEEKIAELEAQIADYRDQLLRKAADVENFRKRMNQEKQNAIEFANQSLLLDIIAIIDDFDRAIQSAETSAELAELPAGKAMLDGIAMIAKRLTGQLEGKWGLKRYNSAGEPFDPNRHEAMLMEKSPDVDSPVVKEEFLKGYTLKDRVIRAAQVKVLMPEG